MPQCIGTTLANKRCKRNAMKNVEYCYCHFNKLVIPITFTPFECPICYELVLHKKKTIDLGCHQFCKACINEWFTIGGNTCPMCRKFVINFT